MSAQPKFIDPLPEVPVLLKSRPNWVRWKLEVVSGKPTKVPYQVNGRKASSTDPSTWTDYLTAVTGATINSEQGIGFVVDGGIIGFDLDNCRNPKTGEVQAVGFGHHQRFGCLHRDHTVVDWAACVGTRQDGRQGQGVQP